MNFNYLFVPLGVDSTPIGLRKCSNDLLNIGSLIAGGVNTLGAILGIESQKKAIDANLQATRETNRTNYQIASDVNRLSQEQFYQNLNWLKKQYYDTDSYARLRQNLAQGGLNPALAYGSASPVGSVGQASPTSFHAAQMEAGHVDPISYDGLIDTVGSSVDAYFQNQLLSAQSENLSADSQIKRAQAFTEFASRLADIRSKYADIELKLSQKGVSEATREKLISEKDKIDSEINEFWTLWEERMKSAKYSNKILERQEKGIELDNDLKEIEKQYKPMLLNAGIKLSQSHSKQLLVSATALMEEAKNSYHYRNEVMPLEVIQKKLANSISEIVFRGDKSYEDFIKNEDMSDYRNFIKTFGELLFRLAK